MNIDINELFKRTSVLLVVLGVVLLLIASFGVVPFGKLNLEIEPIWRYLLAIGGLILMAVGILLTFKDGKGEGKPKGITDDANLKLNVLSETQLARSGLKNAFRIPVDNIFRLQRVSEIIKHETGGRKRLKLLASSGYSYINPNGQVWVESGLGKLLTSGEIELSVVLESPFSYFAETRALANLVNHHHWEEKQIPKNLIYLLEYPNISIRVTEEAVNCSLFFTSNSVYYDPYLWALPFQGGRTENKFWVLEFEKINNTDFDCYGLLEKHFEFLKSNSVPLEDILHSPEDKSLMPRGKKFLEFYNMNPSLALNKYNALTEEFQNRIRAKLSVIKTADKEQS